MPKPDRRKVKPVTAYIVVHKEFKRCAYMPAYTRRKSAERAAASWENYVSSPAPRVVRVSIRVGVDLDGGRVLQSLWRPTPEEIAALANGACICLSVWGAGHPPVWVGVEQVEVML